MSRDPLDTLERLERLQDFAKRLLDPEDLGHAVPREVRRAAREALHGDAARNRCEDHKERSL